MLQKKVLITTPDYPPKLGGLATFTKNIVKSLEALGVDYKILIWDSPRDLLQKSKAFSKEDLYIHIHFMGGLLGGFEPKRSINFCHGSEILFTSPNPLKKLVKRMGKFKALKYFHESKFNFFVSEFTRDKLIEKGLDVHYGRDIILNCCLDSDSSLLSKQCKEFPDVGAIKLCAIARDVPHKNFEGIVRFSHLLAEVTQRKIELSLTSDRFESGENVKINSILNQSDVELLKVYQESHFNLLLSLDESHKGFYEGFGLTTLEAAHQGTPSLVSTSGGLPENVHHLYNGFVFEEVTEDSLIEFYQKTQASYSVWSKNALTHSYKSHGLDLYKKAFLKLLGESNG